MVSWLPRFGTCQSFGICPITDDDIDGRAIFVRWLGFVLEITFSRRA